MIRFEGAVETLGRSAVVRLPDQASRKLPSRGQVAVRGSIDGHEFETVLEPDGHAGHWMRVERRLRNLVGVKAGSTVTLTIEPTRAWPDAIVPPDLRSALEGAPPKVQALWCDITPMARWEWVRWVIATANPDTRRRRVEVTISKMNGGKRRPCCFDLSSCTDPELSKNGKLLEPSTQAQLNKA